MKKNNSSLDLIYCTALVNDLTPYFNLLKPKGVLVQVAAP